MGKKKTSDKALATGRYVYRKFALDTEEQRDNEFSESQKFSDLRWVIQELVNELGPLAEKYDGPGFIHDDGPPMYRSVPPDIHAEAFRVLERLGLYRHYEENPLAARIFLQGFWLGRMVERIGVLPTEPDAIRGRKNERATKGAASTKTGKAKARAEDIRAELDTLWEATPSISKESALQIIAKRHRDKNDKGYSLRVLKDATNGMKSPKQ